MREMICRFSSRGTARDVTRAQAASTCTTGIWRWNAETAPPAALEVSRDDAGAG